MRQFMGNKTYLVVKDELLRVEDHRPIQQPDVAAYFPVCQRKIDSIRCKDEKR